MTTTAPDFTLTPVAPGMSKLSDIPGPKVLLLGDTGTGKTHAIRTLRAAGLETFVLFTEPGMEAINDVNEPTKPCEVHFAYVAPASADWADLEDSARKINTSSIEQLSRMGDINKRKYNEFLSVLGLLHDFTCQRCGHKFGDVSEWGTGRALVVDSLTGLNVMAMNLVVGSKPMKSMADWGISMDNMERLLTKLTTDTRCTLVVTGHLEREADEVTGGVQLMASTLGKKLAPKLPRFFSDVIHTKRDGAKFSWSTATSNAVLKARNIPIAENQTPSFVPLLEGWKRRGGKIEEA